MRNILISVVLAAVLVGLPWLLKQADTEPHQDRVGKAERWSKGFPFGEESQAEVLETGLEDVRGVACDSKGTIYLAEGGGQMLQFPAVQPSKDSKLDEPENADLRGLAFAGHDLLIAEHARGRVMQAGSDAVATTVTGPVGLAAISGALFVTDDRPWPASGEAASFDSTDYSRWLGQASQRVFGAVWQCAAGGGACEQVANQLRHPSGIAVTSEDGPVYVAESDAHEVRWAIFAKEKEGKWQPAGALGSASADGVALPAFLGVAVDHDLVYAAGPNSLYVLSPKDGMLGRIVFDEPVSGVAANGGYVYLIAGHRLCRLKPRTR